MEKLRLLRLDVLAAAWAEQQKNPETQKLAFDERLGMLVDAQWLDRENKRLARALKEAKLKLGNACVEDIDYPPRRELEKAVIRQLASCRWVEGPVKDQARRDLLEVMEDRYGTRSTIMTSQRPTTKWHDHLGDPTMADAICDRLLHNAHRLALKGPSRRKEDSATEK